MNKEEGHENSVILRFFIYFLFLLFSLSCFVGEALALKIALTKDKNLRLELKGRESFSYLYLTDFALDSGKKIAELGDNEPLFNRFRLALGFKIGQDLHFLVEGDFAMMDTPYGFRGKLGEEGISSPILKQLRGFRSAELRQAWLSWYSPIGLLKLGQMKSHWGLGMIANGGDKATGEFATPHFGDLVGRLFWGIPIGRLIRNNEFVRRIILGLAFDVVIRDDNADIFQGDTAIQGAFSLFYNGGKKLFAGLYVALRDQRSGDGTTLNAQAYDLFFRLSNPVVDDGGIVLDVAAEIAIVSGFSTKSRTENAPEGIDLSSLGAIGRLALRFPKSGLRVGFEFGYASGDDNSNDSVSQLFRFDPAYQPSLILFKRLLGAVSAYAYDRLVDTERLEKAPIGSDQVPTFGRIGNSIYMQPVIAYRPFVSNILRGLEAKVGVLYALAVTDFADPLNSFREGGVNHTHLNMPSSGRYELGLELNASLSYSYRLWRSVELSLAVLYGHLFLGDIFVGKDGKKNSIDLVQLRAFLRY